MAVRRRKGWKMEIRRLQQYQYLLRRKRTAVSDQRSGAKLTHHLPVPQVRQKTISRWTRAKNLQFSYVPGLPLPPWPSRHSLNLEGLRLHQKPCSHCKVWTRP